MLMLKKTHSAVVGHYEQRVKTVHDLVKCYKRDADDLTAELFKANQRAEHLEKLAKHGTSTIEAYAAEMADLKAELANANDRLTHMAGIERYAASLKPDALKYREKLRRDREAAAAKRKAKGGADA